MRSCGLVLLSLIVTLALTGCPSPTDAPVPDDSQGAVDPDDQAELLSVVASSPCGAIIERSTAATGSSDLIDSWDCSAFPTIGRETVFEFDALQSGPVAASLDQFTTDLDLLVLVDTGSGLAHDDPAMCVPGAASQNANLMPERVVWEAVAGTTYYLVVDTFGSDDATDFRLSIGAPAERIYINEVGGVSGADEFVEITNPGGCEFDLSELELRIDLELESELVYFSAPDEWLIDPSGGMVRVVEGTTTDAPNEIAVGRILGSTFQVGGVGLCVGSCDDSDSSTFIDYVAYDDNPGSGPDPRTPTGISFAPAPVDSSGLADTESLNRVGFTGSSPTFRAADWSAQTATP